jgi:hypothetical protein
MLNLIAAIEIDMDTLYKALEITWKGMLAILIVIGVIMLVTYLMQIISSKAAAKKAVKKGLPDAPDDGDSRQA